MIKLIWAQTKNNVIGNQDKLPWKIQKEMQHFKNTTLNKPILMGRKTFNTLNNKPLKNRLNYVLSKNTDLSKQYQYDNLIFINDISKIVSEYYKNPNNEIYIIGGKIIYELFFNYADEIIRTIIKKDYQGDTFITNFNYDKFLLISIQDEDEFYIERWIRKSE